MVTMIRLRDEVPAGARSAARVCTSRLARALLAGAVLCASGGLALPARAEGEASSKGRAVLKEALRRNRPRSGIVDVRMTILNRRGQKRDRTIRMWFASDEKAGKDQLLVRFLAPADIRGFSLLSRAEGEQQDQWVFLPRANRVKRIAGGDRTSSFAGSDFTYEDLSPRPLDDATHTLLQDQEVGGQPCFVVESVAKPTTERASSYSKVVVYVRKDLSFPVRIEMYDRHGELAKVQTTKKLVQTDGVTVADITIMKDFRTRSATRLLVQKRQLNVEIPERTFTERNLREGL